MSETNIVITQENFNEKWNEVNHQLELIAKRKVIRKAVSFVGNLVFLFYFSVIAFGLLHVLKSEAFYAYLDATPVLSTLWGVLAPILHQPKAHWVVQVLLLIVPAYILVAVACGIVYALLWFTYQPTTKYSMTENLAEDSATLYKMARFAKAKAANPMPATSFACNALFVFGTIAYVTGYLLEMLSLENTEAIAEAMMLFYGTSISPLINNQLLLTLGTIFFLTAYSGLNAIMGYMLMPMYMTKFPEEWVGETEQFYHQCNPEIKARFEEEEKVLAQAKEINKRRQDERKAFQEELNWKNPIWKKIKIGCSIALVIGMLGVFGWIGSKVDMKEILDTLDSYRGTTEDVPSTEDATEVIEE